jgi:DNA-binding response OmpR family regulator
MSGAHILVVDDESGIRFFLQETLTRDGHQVTAVASGEEALARIAGQEFDLALLDLHMPGMGGMEVLAALRQQAPDTAVIMLTAYGSLETAVEALRQGAHDYLFKPCKTTELRESVRAGLLKRQRELHQRELLALLERSLSSHVKDIRAVVTGQQAVEPLPSAEPPEKDRFLHCGSLVIDRARRVVTVDEHLLDFSATEYDLLAYLAEESPRVVSPQELVRAAQGYESQPWEASDIVRYHIHRIRHKIKTAAGRSDVIRTVRGVGYRLDQ